MRMDSLQYAARVERRAQSPQIRRFPTASTRSILALSWVVASRTTHSRAVKPHSMSARHARSFFGAEMVQTASFGSNG